MVNSYVRCDKGFNVRLAMQNYRVIKLQPVVNSFIEYNNENEIVGLNYPSFKIKLKETVNINKEKFKVKEIKKSVSGNNSCIFLYSSVLNSCSRFIVPLLFNKRTDVAWFKYYMNCYVGKEGEKDYGKFIYIHSRFKPDKFMSDIENSYINHENFIDSEDVDEHFSLYKFSIPEKFKYDFDLILQGKYSKLSDLCKVKILNFHDSDKNSDLVKIFQKNKKFKKKLEKELNLDFQIDDNSELFDIFNVDKETFKKDYIL